MFIFKHIMTSEWERQLSDSLTMPRKYITVEENYQEKEVKNRASSLHQMSKKTHGKKTFYLFLARNQGNKSFRCYLC